MPSDTANVKVGVATLSFDSNDLGYTKGGSEVSVTTDTYVVTVDQFGNTPIKEIITGRTVMVTTPLAETTLDLMATIMPGATLTVDGVTPTKRKVEVVDSVGTDLLSIAAELVLHPQALPAGDVSEDMIIPRASTPGAVSFAYQLDTERVFNAEWKGYPDPTTRVLFIYGDKSVTA
jgi:hypothetical protein